MNKPAQNDKEILHYYDSKGNILGSANRKEIHDKGLINKHIAYLVTNTRNQLLLQLRSVDKMDNPNAWDKPGGHVLIGEQDASREFIEEMCYELPNISGEIVSNEKFKESVRQANLKKKVILTKLITVFNHISTRKRFGALVEEIAHVDILRGKYDGPLNPQPSEIQLIKPFTQEELAKLIEKNPEQVGPDTIEYFEQFASEIFK